MLRIASCFLCASLAMAMSLDIRQDNDALLSTCNTLQKSLPGKVSFPGSAVYEKEGSDYYSLIVSDQRPSCRVTPLGAQDVSIALSVLTKDQRKFAVRSGGHMPWAGMSNIDAPGVTIDMSNLTSVTVSKYADRTLAHVGPGARWGPVYDAMDTHNLTVVGARATTVGVGGFLLGGGINYFNAQYGLAAQNVVNYEMVLANGTIANVNASSHPDLHKALNGGSTNYGIVTRYDLATYPLVPMWGGFRNYNLSQAVPLIKGTLSFMEKQIADTLAGGAVISYLRPFNSSDIALAMLAAYFNGNGPLTDVFDDINNVPFLPGTDSFKNNTDQQDLAGQVDTRFSGGSRAMFSTLSFVADVQFTQDIVEKARKLFERFDGKNISWAASFQANGRAVWRRVAQIPNFQNVETERDLWVFVLVSYSLDASTDKALTKWHHDVMDWMTSEAKKRGLLSKWLYLNYARPDQDVYGSFGKENHQQMKAIQKKYDPENVFGKLWPGGFKL
ncbi:hypothetical protein BDZ94DRAFT_1195506 [Collybia nuda]|uniref:FAD-binding PCMH-type domain-containing protein n=1 Tax=Collybia nuda TaxID=64659 RepID=A0A9P6CH57_9AGAR|nr:hypothetical protein BDZ94DRAFT_1195506 [Collybia nuda]